MTAKRQVDDIGRAAVPRAKRGYEADMTRCPLLELAPFRRSSSAVAAAWSQ